MQPQRHGQACQCSKTVVTLWLLIPHDMYSMSIASQEAEGCFSLSQNSHTSQHTCIRECKHTIFLMQTLSHAHTFSLMHTHWHKKMVTLINHYSLINHYIPHKRSSLLASDITGASFLLLLLLPAVSSCCSSPMFTGSPMATRLHSACLTWTQSSSKGLLSSSPCHHHGYHYQLFWKHCTFIHLMLNVQNNGVKMSRSTLMLFNLSSGPCLLYTSDAADES